jgi:hypothetical protein
MNTSSILVAYPVGGEGTALKLLETLESLADVTLRPYSRTKAIDDSEDYNVILCVVVDDPSVEEAHELQQRMADTPTVVVDSSRGASIPINGFCDLVSPIPQEIIQTVSDILHADLPGTQREQFSTQGLPVHRRLTSRFDATLSRLGGLSQDGEAFLAAATRHLAWELRADHAEAYLVNEQAEARRVFCTPMLGDASAAAEGVCRVLEKHGRLITSAELRRRSDTPLLDHLETRGLNVIAPMLEETRLVGWLALGFENDSVLTDEFLDELQIATHLLSLVLAQRRDETDTGERPWHDVLLAFDSGLILITDSGEIADVAGATHLLGGPLISGQPFKAIRNARIRDVVAKALRSNFATERWTDPRSEQTIVCSAKPLADGAVAIRYCSVHQDVEGHDSGTTEQIDLQPLLESLTIPVEPEIPAESAPSVPKGRVTFEDSIRIRRCAESARSRNAKALKMRFHVEGSHGRGVLFYETSLAEAESQLSDDASQAVKFHVSPA